MASTLNSPQLELAKQIANQYQIVIVLIDDFGKIKWANPSLLSVFGYQLNDVIGQMIFQLCPELSMMDIKKTIKKGSTISVPSFFIDKKGQTLPVALSKGRCSFGGKLGLCLLIEQGEAKVPLHEAILFMGMYGPNREEPPKLITIGKGKKDKTPFSIKTINAIGSYKGVVEQAKKYGVLPDTHVLIVGETGTGKKSLAKQVHQNSEYAENAFVSFDCRQIDEKTPQKLFGFANEDQLEEGLLDEANEGVLYLEHIEELPLLLQDQILSILLDKVFFRQGNKQPQACKIRLIASASIDLRIKIRSGLFHPALYRLLRSHVIYNPPLRERKEQIQPLFKNFLSYYLKEEDVVETIMADTALMEQFENHDYPGNINELKAITKSIKTPQEGFENHPLVLELKNKIPS